jgi:hypothetical protein
LLIWLTTVVSAGGCGLGGSVLPTQASVEADSEGAAQAIADEAAAGAYDLVVLSKGYFEDEVNDEESTPAEVAEAVQALEEVKLVVA